MKKFTHPQLGYTSIHQKDGSFQGKYWSYLRSTLVLETTSSKMNKQFFDSQYKVYSFENNFVKMNTQIKQAATFWAK